MSGLKLGVRNECLVLGVELPEWGYRWRASLRLRCGGVEVYALSTGSAVQWLLEGEQVLLEPLDEPVDVGGSRVLSEERYRLYRVWRGDLVEIWPPWSKSVELSRGSYRYRIRAREASREQDYYEIVQLEQYHYASREEIVAVWRCPVCGAIAEANTQPVCEKDGAPMRLQEVRGSIPSSRFLLLELEAREEYEPRVVGYVRVDTPIPLMGRRLPDGRAERFVREKVFGRRWFHPTFWSPSERRSLLERYKELAELYGSTRLARTALSSEVAGEAIKRVDNAAARIARVVVHPDYRGDGLGVLAVKLALDWIRERRVPESKGPKHVVETIAAMARYNPFFEKAGFRYVWDTLSGRPVLLYAFTDEARAKLERFLREDPYARKHGGRLYKSRFEPVEPMSEPIILESVWKGYRSLLDIDRLPEKLREVLRAFGVERRLVERYVLREASIKIEPRSVTAVVGASGAGKTTLLRLIVGASGKKPSPGYSPERGSVRAPPNIKLGCLIPGECEPVFGDETLLEHLSGLAGDPALAVEILNHVGLGDAVFYRATFSELSTGQKERAKLAHLLALRPNLLVIDEFTAHLDPQTASRVARRLARIAREKNITMVLATNRPEVLGAMEPDKILLVGYGSVYEKRV